MNTLPPSLGIANTAAVLHGPYGAVTRQAELSGTSRQTLYRDAPRVVQAVDGSNYRQQLHHLSQDNDRLRAQRDHLCQLLQHAVVLDADQLARLAATAQAEGVSLPVARRLLLPLLQHDTPSVPQLGRWTHAAAQKAEALLSVLDDVVRPQVEQVAADEIFFGCRPCLMVVEPHSLCWLTGRLADDRNGQTWAEEFRRLSKLQQVTRDGGSGLAKGVALVNQERRQRGEDALADQEDHFHTLREGRRALRQVQQRVCRAIDAVAAAQRREQKKARRTGSRQGTAAATATAQRAALAAVEAGAAVDDPVWAKTRRALMRPQLLTFLHRTHERLAALPVAAEVREAAVRAEGLRQRPAELRGSAPSSAALRGVLLATALVLSLSGPAAVAVMTQVGQVLRQAWRASSLVECLNSVARMQQSRHRRMTPGLLALKRLYWNGRSFDTGRRRRQTPYALLGVPLPMTDWWELLRMSPEQLRQQLSAPRVAA
ncbi:MAG TPA: hypothetical protein VMG10_07810 [Gemmataceae bacterium]|nr:hypothetical protein [Gemmataceae bacterium]